MDRAELIRRLQQSAFDVADEIDKMLTTDDEVAGWATAQIAESYREQMRGAGDDLMDVIGVLSDIHAGDKKEWVLGITGVLLGMVEGVTNDEWASLMAMMD